MTRRDKRDPFRRDAGARLRDFRHEAGFTQEKLAARAAEAAADTSDGASDSKGKVSSIENGFENATTDTWRRYARALEEPLGVEVLDFFTFPKKSNRHAVIDRTRSLTEVQLLEILDRYPPARPLDSNPRKRVRRRKAT